MRTRDDIDMSPQAVALRLDSVRALYKLTSYLSKFKPIEPALAQGAKPHNLDRG